MHDSTVYCVHSATAYFVKLHGNYVISRRFWDKRFNIQSIWHKTDCAVIQEKNLWLGDLARIRIEIWSRGTLKTHDRTLLPSFLAFFYLLDICSLYRLNNKLYRVQAQSPICFWTRNAFCSQDVVGNLWRFEKRFQKSFLFIDSQITNVFVYLKVLFCYLLINFNLFFYEYKISYTSQYILVKLRHINEI